MTFWLYPSRPPISHLVDFLTSVELARITLRCYEDTRLTAENHWEVSLPLLLGDWALAEGFRLTRTLGAEIAVSMSEVLEDILQAKAAWHATGQDPKREEDLRAWLKRVEAPFYALVCEIAAKYAGVQPEALRAAWRFGDQLGLAVDTPRSQHVACRRPRGQPVPVGGLAGGELGPLGRPYSQR